MTHHEPAPSMVRALPRAHAPLQLGGALVAGVLVALVVAGCGKSPSRGAEPAPSGTPPAAPAQPADQPKRAASAFDEANYMIAIRPRGTYKSGQAGAVEVVLKAKPPYHCNDKYPYKLKLEVSPGVTFPNPVVTRDAVKVEHMQATMTVPFTPDSPGKKIIAGRYQFSVCSADNCLVDKQDVQLAVDVM